MSEARGGAGSERFLVTGAFGCIGAWTVRRLVLEGAPVWAYDLPGSSHRLRLVMSEEQLQQVNQVQGDVTDLEGFERTVANNGITHIVHLAALQVPFVRADPVRGAQVNVVGTTVVFETAKRHAGQVRGICYASSAAVYGPADGYPPGPLPHDAQPMPGTLYAVFKEADEGVARIYWQDYQLGSVGLRPYVVYGPGRDQGMTSTPTKAMLAAALGRPYHISYGGEAVFQHAEDAASVFLAAARGGAGGAPVYNLGGSSAHMGDVVAAIEEAEPAMAGRITFESQSLPHPRDIDASELQRFLPETSWRPLREGVRQTVEHFKWASGRGLVDADRILSDGGPATQGPASISDV
jgi:UDP-glucuronate 4-epimerase